MTVIRGTCTGCNRRVSLRQDGTVGLHREWRRYGLIPGEACPGEFMPPKPTPVAQVDDVEWRPVVGYEGLYEVSADGRVRSLPRTTTRGIERVIHFLKSGGYPYVTLYRENVARTRTVHILIAEAFIGPRPPGLDIRHLDGNCRNSVLTNLAYGTPAENSRDTVEHGHHRQTQVTHCPHGHTYDEVNTRWYRGRRSCRTCSKLRGKFAARLRESKNPDTIREAEEFFRERRLAIRN